MVRHFSTPIVAWRARARPISMLMFFFFVVNPSSTCERIIMCCTDLALTSFEQILAVEFGDLGDLSSYTYAYSVEPKKRLDHEETMREYKRRRLLSPAGRVPGSADGHNEDLIADPLEVVHTLCYRMWGMRDGLWGQTESYTSSGEDYAATVHGFFNGYKLVKPIGGRSEVMKKALAEYERKRDSSGYPNEHPRDCGWVDVCFNCAVSDVLPPPEARKPPMHDLMEEGVPYLPQACEFEWNHFSSTLLVHVLKRLPRQKEGEIKAKRGKVSPQCYVL